MFVYVAFCLSWKGENMEELEKELEEINNRLFMLEMKDRWEREDYQLKKVLEQRKKDLEAQKNARS